MFSPKCIAEDRESGPFSELAVKDDLCRYAIIRQQIFVASFFLTPKIKQPKHHDCTHLALIVGLLKEHLSQNIEIFKVIQVDTKSSVQVS